jgi:hypothetical protein
MYHNGKHLLGLHSNRHDDVAVETPALLKKSASPRRASVKRAK